jgi:hypothetical protein
MKKQCARHRERVIRGMENTSLPSKSEKQPVGVHDPALAREDTARLGISTFIVERHRPIFSILFLYVPS